MTDEDFQHPAKTVNSIITNICTVLREADKLANHENVTEDTAPLRDALRNLLPADINEMLTHINAMYQACESMKITGIAFRCDTAIRRVIAIVTIQFGVREIQLFAPFDDKGAANMFDELVGSAKLLEQSQPIIQLKH